MLGGKLPQSDKKGKKLRKEAIQFEPPTGLLGVKLQHLSQLQLWNLLTGELQNP